MARKKKKGTKAIRETGSESVKNEQSDMSKYARAVSNKSKINYADLKLVRPDSSRTGSPDGKKGGAGQEHSGPKQRPDQKKAANKGKKPAAKNSDSAKKPKTGKAGAKQPPKDEWVGEFARNAMKGLDEPKKKKLSQSVSSGATAEERYSNALGSEDHYSSAVEKYYLKYPEKKRPRKSGASYQKKPVRRKKKRTSAEAGSKAVKPSMAEIAAQNKRTPEVKKHLRSVRDARAKGVVSQKVGNRSLYRRKKKRSGALNVLAVTALLLFLSVVCVAVFFNVREIKVVGDSPYSEASIKKLCSFGRGDNILFIDTQELERTIERELPYIEECSVERRFPSSVIIRVSKADMLGVIQGAESQWSVISRKGKILETATNLETVEAKNVTGSLTYTPQFGSVNELAEARKLPVLTGLNIQVDSADGYITGESLRRLNVFVTISNAADKVEMKLSGIGWSDRGYEAEYDKRLNIIFGETEDEKTILHRFKEVHKLAVEEGKIAENDMGEICFSKNRTFFLPAYEVSAEALEKIQEQRRVSTCKKMLDMGEIFIRTGYDWYKGRLKTE